MMDGRVKTLHPRIHGGLLALRKNATHMEEAKKHALLKKHGYQPSVSVE
jgi:phosphoribosylaminoimidazolecarboxamide formyltransferase/IMP cyclohydrolase